MSTPVTTYVKGMRVRSALMPGLVGTVVDASVEAIWLYVQWPDEVRAHQVKYTSNHDLYEVE